MRTHPTIKPRIRQCSLCNHQSDQCTNIGGDYWRCPACYIRIKGRLKAHRAKARKEATTFPWEK